MHPYFIHPKTLEHIVLDVIDFFPHLRTGPTDTQVSRTAAPGVVTSRPVVDSTHEAFGRATSPTTPGQSSHGTSTTRTSSASSTDVVTRDPIAGPSSSP